MLELDVRRTKDGQVVVFHDSTLIRVAGDNSKISDLDYAALPKFNLTVAIDTLPGKDNLRFATKYLNSFYIFLFR